MQVSDAGEIVSKFGSPHARRCGARTRCGGVCRNLAVRSMKRCRMHGGKSYKGFSHPNYKHGCYSKHCILGMLKREAYRDARRREKRQREIDQILERERLEREAKEARKAKRRKAVTYDADFITRAAALMRERGEAKAHFLTIILRARARESLQDRRRMKTSGASKSV